MHGARAVAAVAWLALASFVANVVVACGSDFGANLDAARDGGVDASDDRAPATVADGSSDAASGGDAADADAGIDPFADVDVPDAAGSGSIFLFTQVIEEDAGPRGYLNLQASFTRTGTSSSSSNCQSTSMPPCHAVTCQPSEAGPPPTDPLAPPNAGRIDVTGANLHDAGVLLPNGQGRYEIVYGDHSVFSGGESILFSWAGQSKPVAGPAPGQIVLTAPHRPAMTTPFSDGMKIPRNADFVLTWSNPSGQTSLAKVGVLMSRSTSPGNYTSVSCNFDALAGSGTVPAALLGMLSAGEGLYQISITSEITTQLATWKVRGVATTTSTSNRGISGVAAVYE